MKKQEEQRTVNAAIAAATADADQGKRAPRKTYTEEEKHELKKKGKTQGRKDVKLDRINLGFEPDIYEYIEIMGTVTGKGPTAFVNAALRQHMEMNRDLYDQAIAFKEAIEKRNF